MRLNICLRLKVCSLMVLDSLHSPPKWIERVTSSKLRYSRWRPVVILDIYSCFKQGGNYSTILCNTSKCTNYDPRNPFLRLFLLLDVSFQEKFHMGQVVVDNKLVTRGKMQGRMDMSLITLSSFLHVVSFI